jgi:repressor LexA
MAVDKLTTRQRKIFDFIKDFVRKRGFPPTLSEIGEKFGIQPSAVRMHLLLMEKKGVLRYVRQISRGIEILTERRGIPIYGEAPAGHPFMSQENILDTFELRKYIAASDDMFGIIVRGDSMKEAQIMAGDVLFVDPKRVPHSGNIVVALVEGEPTIKFYREENGRIILEPANKRYTPIVVAKSDENFSIAGVVVGMVRAIDKKTIDALRTA